MLRVGLTGGIAAGKSTIGSMFVELGAVLVDADQLAREVMTPDGEAYLPIRQAFGDDILDADGGINRQRLGEIVFVDSGARRRLEQITHPAIGRALERRMDQLRGQGCELMLYEAALLIETGRVAIVDVLVVVVAEDEQRIQRLMKRSALTREAALTRLGAQLSQTIKARRADYVIDNSGPLDATRRQVQTIWQALRRRARKETP